MRTQDIPNSKSARKVRFIAELHININESDKDSVERFLAKTYAISNTSDRIGFRLEGEGLEHKNGADNRLSIW